MQRKVLVATVATAPLLAMAFGAYAETVINTARTTPIATATATSGGAADDVKVDTGGGITLTTAGPLVTLNSNNKVTLGGNGLSTVGVDNSTGVLIQGGTTGSVTNNAAISLTEDYTPTDTDSDGDLDGVFAKGANRYGVRLVGPGVFTGDIVQGSTGSITIEGNNSAGISLESGLVGNLTTGGSISVLGDNAYGVHVAAPVTGKVTINGATTATGLNATGVAIDGNVSGAFALQGSVTSTGYRYTSRPAETAIAKLDADDLLQGGPAVRIGGNVAGGVLLNGPTYSTVVDGTTTTTTTISSSTTSTATISTYGAAPALLIGSDTQAVSIGAVGAADNAYGLVAKGGISANGVYDKVTATAVQIGGATGQAATLAGGARFDSTVAASAREANATAVNLTAGANVPSIWNRGQISSASASYAGSGLTGDARGVVINAGASATSLNNSGTIQVTRTGELGDAVGVLDSAGTLTNITNSGRITAQVVAPAVKSDGTAPATAAVATGTAIALDLRASTAGVTVNQVAPTSSSATTTFPSTDTVTTATSTTTTGTPLILGNILFGSGADTLNLQAGSVLGDVAFGAGADTLSIGGGGVMLGALRDSDGQLAINIGNGSLGLTNAETINASSLTLGADSKMVFTADPSANNGAGANTRLVISGSANIASGAQIGLRLTNLLTAPTSYTVITAGSLTAGTINQDLLGGTPYLYVASSRTDTNNVYLDVRRRTAAEIGMNSAQSSAYDATFAALGKDKSIASAFLSQTTKDGLLGLYDQMMPDQGEGFYAALQNVNHAISAATAFRPDPGDRYGPDSLWIQEINTLVRRDTDDTMGSDTQAFGFVGGYEAMGDAGGALGLTLAYVSVEEHDIAAKVGEQTTGNFVQLGAYWRRAIGGWRMNVGGGGGYGWYDGDRTFNSGDLNGDGVADVQRKNSAKWNGYTFNAFAGTAYEAKFAGRYFVRPEASLDYLYLSEGERKESGGGDGFDQIVHKRKSSSLTGDVGVVFGADYGRDLWWRPEVRVGYRQLLAGEIGDTVAQYTGGGTPFTLAAANDKDGAVTLGFALRAGTPMSYLALEANAEAAKKQKRYNLKLTGRAMF
ncbi:autotransporter domain-containing protein [Caulobacter sp. UNC279MFTsu5.1]|uniref:autotransporter domain-containing protein n=1 Tax=Caulobacter sp. UNC279MFTsu5.1 TaxID=1502775 RepID=UPI0003806D4F|nr:autotransporter outer membrane beta-barrel domain-containing protein [Caulobacter sp. UNC279MFTsu5.1]SFK52059.1 Autotransporter beta-domain-containing protein [Caulobacter sp. UNC279MFTsu5.1]